MRTLSMGAGVQTTAMLIKYNKVYDYVIFSDTGAEMPETYWYIENYLKPFCKEIGVKWQTVKDEKTTLYDECWDKRITPILSTRHCTVTYKIHPIRRFLRSVGANSRHPALVDIGFSLDESHRFNPNPKHRVHYEKLNFPLLDDKITREQCKEIIKKKGWPIPPKSGCYFCGFSKLHHFRKLKAEHPELFKKAMELEKNASMYPRKTIKSEMKLENMESNMLDNYIDEEPATCDTGHCFV